MTEIVVKGVESKGKILQNVSSGESFERFLQSQKATQEKEGLSDIEAYNLRATTLDILNHCNPHDATDNRETTHLVVGYVQSGKTMSFTGVLAMAHDNGYRVAIILTGVTNNLLDQTSKRLVLDLGDRDAKDNFSFIENPSDTDTDCVVKALRLSDKPLIIIPILKHTKYINNIATIFRCEKVKRVLGSETVIIIDDEADQTSLNGYGYENSKQYEDNEKEQTATYAAILDLRSALAGNSYIQYTATPQANILITTMDLLSPKSHTLLQPGESYIGGKKMFGMDEGGQLYNGKLAIEIPPGEVYHKKKNPLREMPKSLIDALMMHVWAVVLVIKWYKRKGISQLSMMVHPTDIIEGNKTFEGWIREEINLWSDCFDKPEWELSHQNLLNQFKDLFPKAIEFYPEEGRPTFEEVKRYLPDIINDCMIYRITGDSDDDSTDIKWNAHRMNVLVGAQMLNRGFTVEKLTTTYMPRYTTGKANADTIEQRCRFFGYKKKYIESCRVFLPKESIQDYKDYVRHEEELRALLAKCDTLKEYERCVMLSPHLRPTRQNVLPKSIVKSRLVNWKRFEKISGSRMAVENKALLNNFVSDHLHSACDFQFDNYDSSKYKDGEIKKHSLLEMDVKEVIALLSEYVTGDYRDTVTKMMLIRYLGYLEESSGIAIKVIFMSNNKVRERSCDINEDDSWNVNQLFQGRSNTGESDNYIGDLNLYDNNTITIQIHHLRLKNLQIKDSDKSETYALAIHIPDKIATQYVSSLNK